jgi:uncharacterized membrane protein
MKTRILNRWHALRATFWFVPSLFAAAAVLLALGLLEIDERIAEHDATLEMLYGGDAEGARSVLVMLAGSMIGTAGVAFSITMVVLSLTSSQYGPRLLRNFMRDPGNQIVLGTFVATFLYCLLVVRTVVEGAAVPALSVSVAVALGMLGLAVLIYFFHHVATTIQAGYVVAAVARDLDAAIGRFCAEDAGERESGDPAAPPAEPAAIVAAPCSGYLQAIGYETLVGLACERDGRAEALRRAGHFVIEGSPLARLVPAERFDERDRERAARAFVIGAQATREQDLEFSVRQLVEVALRALSPGINDPFTAANCIDWLGAALARLARSGLPPRRQRGPDGRVRLIADAPSFAGVADAAFQQIRQAAGPHVAVSIRLLDTYAAIAPHLRARADVATIAAIADQTLASALAEAAIEPDRAALAARHAEARRALAEAESAAA